VLILSRRLGQSIMIGADIEVKVLGWKDGQLSLGITAPKSIAVYRREVYDAISEENQAAAKPTGIDLALLPRK
jgi:carbon storage regulator